ncbi:hypothetical protein CSPAE12_06487 [Colletotrichum incanum]|nr:hypothetical protein CSPAE12_06487 [Colletotrichum incanum]
MTSILSPVRLGTQGKEREENGLEKVGKLEDHQQEPTRLYLLRLLKAPPSNGFFSCSRTLPLLDWTCSGATTRHVWLLPPRCRPRCGERPPRPVPY